MTNEGRPLREGYQPSGRMGYQPKTDQPSNPNPQDGYIPTGHGDNPSNPEPSPPSEE